MSSTPTLAGVLPVVPTPFATDGSCDLAALRRVVDYAVECGVTAVVYPGVASEDVQLSAEERATCVATVIEQVAERCAVIAGVNSADPDEMVRLAGQMAELGANAIMAMAVPAMEERGYSACFAAIAEATGGLPIILQNLFKPRGADLSVAAIRELARDVDAIRWVKEEAIPSGPTVSALVGESGGIIDGVIGGGGARYLFDELERGVIACMPAIELLELHVALFDAFKAGNRERAFQLYEASLPLLLLQAPYRMRLTKLILQRRGIFDTVSVRENLPQLDDVGERLALEMYRRLEHAGPLDNG